MGQQKKARDGPATGGSSKPLDPEAAQPPASPGTDPTNPHNQEPTGEWVAAERASDRRNSEPGLTEHDRQQRKY